MAARWRLLLTVPSTGLPSPFLMSPAFAIGGGALTSRGIVGYAAPETSRGIVGYAAPETSRGIVGYAAPETSRGIVGVYSVIVLAFLFGCLAAVANAATNVMQRSVNRAESARLQFSFQLIKDLLRSPLWLTSVGTMIGSFLLQAAGLGLGTLAAIEPLLVLELPLTLIGARFFLGARLGRREWAAIAVMTAGTIGLIAFLGPTGGRGTGIGWPVWVAAIGATATPVGIVFWLGHRARSAGRRAGLLGIATGLGFGLAAALTKGMTAQFSSGGITGVLTAWQLYAAGAAGLFALWLNQNAINAGRLAAAQPGVTLSDPCVSIVWGAVVFHETMRSGVWIIAAAASAAAMSASAITLARSPATTGDQAAREEGAGEPDGAARAA